jgi:hypothetical protein
MSHLTPPPPLPHSRPSLGPQRVVATPHAAAAFWVLEDCPGRGAERGQHEQRGGGRGEQPVAPARVVSRQFVPSGERPSRMSQRALRRGRFLSAPRQHGQHAMPSRLPPTLVPVRARAWPCCHVGSSPAPLSPARWRRSPGCWSSWLMSLTTSSSSSCCRLGRSCCKLAC